MVSSEIKIMEFVGQPLPSDFSEVLPRCTKLEELDLCGAIGTLPPLSTFPRSLKVLDLEGLPPIPFQEILSLSLNKLEELYLEGQRPALRDLKLLLLFLSVKKLRVLDLSCCGITNEGAALLASELPKFPLLEAFYAYGNPFDQSWESKLPKLVAEGHFVPVPSSEGAVPVPLPDQTLPKKDKGP